MPVLILFDIDGTLVRFKPGLTRKLFSRMSAELFGSGIPEGVIPRFAGMTDLQILKIVAGSIGVSQQELSEKLNDIWEKMITIYRPYSTPQYISIMPGIKDLLQLLNDEDNIHLGLITGNFERNAYMKLRSHNLDTIFKYGGFGDDDEDRNNLPLIAIERANKFNSTSHFTPENTLIVGDTLRDIECAHINNIKVLSVATGEFGFDELLLGKPDLLLKDFSDFNRTKEEISKLLKIN